MDFVAEEKSAKPLKQDSKGGIFSNSKLIVKQKKHLGEVFIDWEFANEYEIYDEKKKKLGRITEQKKSLAHAFFIRRMGNCRNYDITFCDNFENQLMIMSRPFTLFGLSKVTVIDASGKCIGTIKRQFPPLIKRRYMIFDSAGLPAAEIIGSIIHIWTFKIFDNQNQECAGIYKKWSGIGKELFTDADNFLIDMQNLPQKEELRKLILASSIIIDFDFFERSSNK
jgi:hypothetical protein